MSVLTTVVRSLVVTVQPFLGAKKQIMRRGLVAAGRY